MHSLWGYYLAASLFLLCGSFTNFLTLSVAPGTHTFTHSYTGSAGDFTARRLAILGKYK